MRLSTLAPEAATMAVHRADDLGTNQPNGAPPVPRRGGMSRGGRIRPPRGVCKQALVNDRLTRRAQSCSQIYLRAARR